MIRIIHGEELNGVAIDAQTRCSHYNSELDVIAIKFKCCGRWFPCFECHQECAEHTVETWGANEWNEAAILCGVCGNQQSITEYISGDSVCPECKVNFNPGCAKHHHLYFGD